MDQSNTDMTTRMGAYAAIGGAVSMLIGAGLMGTAGASIDEALARGDMANYLAAAAEVRPLLVANTSFWIVGVLLLSVAGSTLSRLCVRRRTIAQLALVCYQTAAPLAIIAFVGMLAVVVTIAPDTSPTSVTLATALGWIGSYADWIATVLFIGAGPGLLALAGRGDWMPNWLAGWGAVAAAAGVLPIIGMYLSDLTSYTLAILPVGLGWMLVTGIVLLRRTSTLRQGKQIASQVA